MYMVNLPNVFMLFVAVNYLLLIGVNGVSQSAIPWNLEVMSFCQTKVEIGFAVAKALTNNELIVVINSMNFEEDGYIPLYIDWILELFTSKLFKTRFIVVYPTFKEFVEYTDYLITILPKETIFCDHGVWSRRLPELSRMKDIGISNLKIHNFGLFHFNDERPWESNVTDLLKLYSKHELVFRNYFYDPLVDIANHSHTNIIWLPVGPSYYSHWLSRIHIPLVPASQRLHLCRYMGRRNHLQRIPERDALHHVAAMVGDNSFPCQIDEVRLDYGTYLQYLQGVKFVPCPPGNNPETFRHYEVCEYVM